MGATTKAEAEAVAAVSSESSSPQANDDGRATAADTATDIQPPLDDKQIKLQLVLDEVTRLCCQSDQSEHETLRTIQSQLEQGLDQLQGQCLSGGNTNYSYKLYLERNPTVAVFAKLAFPYALWNPDHSQEYDVVRTDNEFAAMQQFSALVSNAPVATPYCCVPLRVDDRELRLLVTEWAPADTPLALHYAQGHVNDDIVDKVATAFATLNLTESFNPNFNVTIKPCVKSMFPQFMAKFETAVTAANNDPLDPLDDNDSCPALCRDVGLEEFQSIMDAADVAFHSPEALVHGDGHCFNVLVSAASNRDIDPQGKDTDTDRNNNIDPSVYICDWEMACAGPLGSDSGRFLSWPLACLMCHAVRGNIDHVRNVRRSVDRFWQIYSQRLQDFGKDNDDQHMAKVFRSTLGWAGYMMFPVYYLYDIFLNYLPTDDLSVARIRQGHGAIGCLGLRLMVLGFSPRTQHWDYEKLWDEYDQLLKKDVDALLLNEPERIARSNCISHLHVNDENVDDKSLVAVTLRSMRSSFHAARRQSSLLPLGRRSSYSVL